MRVAWRARGFTLIEMLIAIMIMGFLFSMVYAAITSATNSRRAALQNDAASHQLQYFMNVIDNDISQIIARPGSRADVGQLWALNSGERQDGLLLSFSRNGWPVTVEQHKSDLGRVGYELQLNNSRDAKASAYPYKIYRLAWRDIDAVSELQAKRRLLLGSVKSLKFKFMDKNYQWLAHWPPREGQSASPNWQQNALLPRAIGMELEIPRYGKLERVWRVGVAHGF